MAAVSELYQMRLMIDTSVARILAPRLLASQIDVLRRLVDDLAQLVDGERYVDYGAYLECDRAFHSAVVSMMGNRRLMAMYDEINLPLWLVRAQQHAAPPRDASASLADHRAILSALQQRDPDAAAEAMRAHIEGSLVKLGVTLGLTDAPAPREANQRRHSS